MSLTARDALGASTVAAITINPAPIENSLTITGDNYSDSCPAGTSTATTFICSGQTGSISVRIANPFGGGISGRLVRFDVVQGAFQFFTELPGQTPTFALSVTVPTDLTGAAVARFRANPGAGQQIAIVQATDVNTGAYVRATFVIVPVTNANAADLVVIPDTVTFTGPDTQTCSFGVSSTFYVSADSLLILSSSRSRMRCCCRRLPVSGGGFTVTTVGACPFTNDTFVITDAVGHTITATANSAFGANPPPTNTTPGLITVTPSTISPLPAEHPPR
jgi:hypothetical protein